jgi:plastocyanin
VTRSRTRLAALSICGLAVGGGCGDDGADDAEADDSGDAATCVPVAPELEAEADELVEIELAEYAFDPAAITVPAGVVTFAATNTGEQYHELAFLPGGGDVPLTNEGEPDEDALAEAGAFELEGFAPNETCNATYDLEPGSYTLFCIVEDPDGVPHSVNGMVGTLTVE